MFQFDRTSPEYPLDVRDIHISDPFILADEESGLYYMYSGYVPEADPGIRRQNVIFAYVSADLIHWSRAVRVFDGEEIGFWGIHDFWAPECHRWRGSYYLVSSFRGKGTLRRCQFLKADSPLGPFRPIPEGSPEELPAGGPDKLPAGGTEKVPAGSTEKVPAGSPDKAPAEAGPVTPEGWQCLDGTLYEDPNGKPWMVFCHEWLQTGDGQIAAIPLSEDLGHAIGRPIILMRASDAPWAAPFYSRDTGRGGWVTDGPFLYRMEDGSLAMLWSNFTVDGYAVGYAKSRSGQIFGPWDQEKVPLYFHDGGHAMLFKSFGGTLLMALHCPNTPHTKKRLLLFEMEDRAGRLSVVNEITGNWYNGAKGPANGWVYREKYRDFRGLQE